MVAFIVPGNYGAVIGVALGAIPVLGFVHGNITGSLRKEAKVPYPHSYASCGIAVADFFQCPQTFRPKDAPRYVPAEVTIIVCWGGVSVSAGWGVDVVSS
ncbi:hypothetical protein N7497_001127 [Penicillium chrysogenum]|nr:hypothetical protein N7497_001127 [Penicillium chrysogenum]